MMAFAQIIGASRAGKLARLLARFAVFVIASALSSSLSWAACDGGSYPSSAAAWSACVASTWVKDCSGWNHSGAEYFVYKFTNPYWSEYCFPNGDGCGGSKPNTSSSSECKPACATGETFNSATGSCDAPPAGCETGQHEEGGQCVPDNMCAQGQTYSTATQNCEPDTPPPTPGSDAPMIGVQTGTADGSGNIISRTPEYQSITGGGKLTFNCGGWECTVDASGFRKESEGGGCTAPVGGGPSTCAFIPKYTGRPATINTAVPNAPPTIGESDAPMPSAGCPTGYVFESPTGLCVRGVVAPTPSTTQSPGSVGEPGVAACPVGYTRGADGRCTGAPGPTGGEPFGTGCPAGYTLSNGVCIGTGEIGPGGVPRPGSGQTGSGNGTGTCGGPGQPACSVTIEGPGSLDPINHADATPGSKSEADGLFEGVGQRIADWSRQDPANEAKDGFRDLWIDYITPVPDSGCQPFNSTIGGHVWSFDLCPTAEKISSIGNYAMWLMLAIGSFVMVTGGRK